MPNKTKKMFDVAREVAKTGDTNGVNRRYRLGAVGLRSDGVIVCACNLPVMEPSRAAHAEYRVCQKMDWGGEVYVVRIDKGEKFRLSRPCKRCQAEMINSGVRRCYYSISEDDSGNLEFGVIRFNVRRK